MESGTSAVPSSRTLNLGADQADTRSMLRIMRRILLFLRRILRFRSGVTRYGLRACVPGSMIPSCLAHQHRRYS